jgi:TRAP-type C4-dicarboxylate transport system permease small subunit
MVTMKEQFDLLYANLKYYRDSSIDSVFKVAGFLIIVGGWLLTSRDARAFLASNSLIRFTAVAVILVIAVVYTLIAVRILRDSQRAFDRLRQLSYMPTELFQELLIRPTTILPFVLANIMISLALCVFILQFA